MVLIFGNAEDHAFYPLSVKQTIMINANFGSGVRPEALQTGSTAHTGLCLSIKPNSHIPNVWQVDNTLKKHSN